ncbi:unnamed protein product, partial [Allacma fusca]
ELTEEILADNLGVLLKFGFPLERFHQADVFARPDSTARASMECNWVSNSTL